MRVSQLIGAACLLGALVASGISGSTEVDSQGFVRITSEQVKWVQVRTGIEAAILSGDPMKPGGIYVQRVKFSPGTFSAPPLSPGRSPRHRDQGDLVYGHWRDVRRR
jgi:hypothetical protein